MSQIINNKKFLGYLSRTELWNYIEDVADFFENLISPMLGPHGNWKLIIDCEGESVITSCGGLLLEFLKHRAFKSPLARIFVQEGLSHDKITGDGTKYLLLLSSMLIKKGIHLIRSGLAISEIIEGYKIATELAIHNLENLSSVTLHKLCSKEGKTDSGEIMYNLFLTTIPMDIPYERVLEELCRYLSTLYIRYGISHLSDEDIFVVNLSSGSAADSTLLSGLLIEKSLESTKNNLTIEHPNIVILRKPYGIMRGDRNKRPSLKDIELPYNLIVSDPLQLKRYLWEENNIMNTYVDLLKKYNAQALFTGGKLNKKIVSRLKSENILVFEGLNEKVLKAISKVSGARLISTIDDLSSRDIGHAEKIGIIDLGSEKYYLIKPRNNINLPITVVLKGTKYFSKNAEHYVRKLRLLYNTITERLAPIPAGGASEVYLAMKIRGLLYKYPSKLQISINTYADILERLAMILILNMGLDPLETLSKLRSIHVSTNGEMYGIDAFTRLISDMINIRKLEHYEIKKKVLLKAYELAKTVLRLNMILFHRQEMEEVPSKIGKRYVNI
ncbi:MAG: TCP-1/cpn60 chaperonin family protein [Candidatus Bathyarchaeia archaeon]